ncbi:MAG: DUF4147 domain-containing protein [Pirellulales bacterium]
MIAQFKGERADSAQARDALAIWAAGVESVLPENVVPGSLVAADEGLIVAGRLLPAGDFESVYVFGAGKAGAAMAVAVENALRVSRYWDSLRGRVNVPGSKGNLPETYKIQLQVARPAGQNLPTEKGHSATGLMIDDLVHLDRRTIALGLISGGGSALLVQPREGVGLEQIGAVTTFLQDSGATIHELNGVRSWLSLEKAGGLARQCNAGRIETLIISDVVGDDLGVIASGPCCASDVTARQAYACLKQFVEAAKGDVPDGVRKSLQFIGKLADEGATHPALGRHVRNNLIATNDMAMKAAQRKAEDLEYRVVMCGSTNQGEAYSGGRQFANFCQRLRELGGRWCVISGGEPTLVVNAKRPDGCRGGRNQAWALAALSELWKVRGVDLLGMALLAGGTDGEDGPCDVAGAVATQEVLTAADDQQLDLDFYLTNNDEYSFFERTGGLFSTGGGTHTNVSDLRVACIDAA